MPLGHRVASSMLRRCCWGQKRGYTFGTFSHFAVENHRLKGLIIYQEDIFCRLCPGGYSRTMMGIWGIARIRDSS